MQLHFQRGLGVAAALVIASCAPGGPQDASDTEAPPTGTVKSPEAIDTQNDPNRFNLEMRKGIADLPASGVSTRKPFPSNWWPMSRGGITHKWNGGQPGPADKYDQLVTPDKIKDVQLTLAKKNWKDEPVNQDAQPETFHVGPAGEWELKNHGRYGSTDPESWWGHCNGWASYVLNEDEPERAVSVRYDPSTRRVTECTNANDAGCVRFELGDINALGAELYFHDAARMAGRRCETEASEFKFDASGRIDSVECRDGNAGSFHLVVTNMIGRLQRPFIVDLTADRQVWNYPVYKYEITRNDSITVEQALRDIGAPAETTTWTYNTAAKKWRRVSMKAWLVEDAIPPSTEPVSDLLDRYSSLEYYDYILELDSNDNVIGGEWVGTSKTRHPDFLWYSFSNSSYSSSSDDLWDGDNEAIRYSIFKAILTLSQGPAPGPGPGPGPTGDVVKVEATPNLAIPDNDPAGVSHTLNVSPAFTATKVKLNLDITHTYRGDLIVKLKHDGREVTVHNQAGGSADDLKVSLEVGDFANVAAGGDWTLLVSDVAGADLGTIVRWGLELSKSGGGGGTGGNVTREFAATPALAIPDNNSTGVSTTITVNDSIRISELKVEVNITHTYVGDLKVTLEKDGQTQVLHANEGGGADNIRKTFETRAFVNATTRGVWTLRVVDTAAIDVGTVDSWKLIATGAQN